MAPDRRDIQASLAPFVPALNTLLVTALLVAAVPALSLAADTGTPASREVLDSTSWLLWRAVGAVSALLFVLVFSRGVKQLREFWRVGGRAGRTRVLGFVGLAVVFAGLAATAVTIGAVTVAAQRQPLPIAHVGARTSVLVGMGAIAVVPWLAVVWLVHATCRDINLRIAQASATPPPEDADGPSPQYPPLRQLLDLWDVIVRCVLVFSAVVVAAIFTTGAMRGVSVEAFPVAKGQPDPFPSVYVLLYGMAFAFLLLLVTVPMVASWRSKAAKIVEATVPVPDDLALSEEWDGRRKRLEVLLHLDGSLVWSPLTALSALTPLLTSALAAFLPELAK